MELSGYSIDVEKAAKVVLKNGYKTSQFVLLGFSFRFFTPFFGFLRFTEYKGYANV